MSGLVTTAGTGKVHKRQEAHVPHAHRPACAGSNSVLRIESSKNHGLTDKYDTQPSLYHSARCCIACSTLACSIIESQLPWYQFPNEVHPVGIPTG